MRRVFGLALVALVVLAAPAFADAPEPSGEMVLAVEDDPVGPEPMDRLDADNPARELAGFENPDVPFTWGAAWLLSFAFLVLLSLFAGLYWLLVHRPSRESDESS